MTANFRNDGFYTQAVDGGERRSTEGGEEAAVSLGRGQRRRFGGVRHRRRGGRGSARPECEVVGIPAGLRRRGVDAEERWSAVVLRVAAARPGEACLAGGEWPEAVERATARLAWWDGSCGGDLRERSSCRGGARHGDADDGSGAVWQRRERRQEAEKAAAARAACGHGVTVVVRGNKVDAGVLCGAAKLTAVADWRGGD